MTPPRILTLAAALLVATVPASATDPDGRSLAPGSLDARLSGNLPNLGRVTTRPDAAPMHSGFWAGLIRDNARPFAAVVGAMLLQRRMEAEWDATRDSGLLDEWFPVDERVRNALRRGDGDTDSHGFVEDNVTPITRGIAFAAILSVNGTRWRDSVRDVVGLWEAQRFTTAMAGIMKIGVARERPALESIEEGGASPSVVNALHESPNQHQSFWSFHAASAYTTLSYADLVLSRRLESRPALRRWIRGGLYALGGYIALARVMQDGHWFTDVVAGSFAGVATGRSFYAHTHPGGPDRFLSWDPGPGRRRFRISPPIPVQGGAAITLSFVP